MCIVKTSIGVNVCVPLRKKRTCYRVSPFLTVFFCLRAPQLNLAFRMTGVEDTHLTLAAILFQAEIDNSLNLFHYITEESCRVSVPVESIIL